jgi:hypothetical protein
MDVSKATGLIIKFMIKIPYLGWESNPRLPDYQVSVWPPDLPTLLDGFGKVVVQREHV